MNKKIKIQPILFLILLSVHSLGAQSRAFLQSGPTEWDSMPAIGLNAIKGYRGIYMFSMENADTSLQQRQAPVTVYFANTAVPAFSEWKTATTSPYIIYESTIETIFIYTHLENWTFFIDFQTKENINLSFLENIVRQMIFFVKDGDDFINASFPAIVEF